MFFRSRTDSEKSDSPLGLTVKNGEVIRHKAIPGETSVEIPEGITKIGWGAFAEHQHLEKIRFPSTLKEIHPDAFNFCTSLEEIEIPEGIELLCFHNFC